MCNTVNFHVPPETTSKHPKTFRFRPPRLRFPAAFSGVTASGFGSGAWQVERTISQSIFRNKKMFWSEVTQLITTIHESELFCFKFQRQNSSFCLPLGLCSICKRSMEGSKKSTKTRCFMLFLRLWRKALRWCSALGA